MMVPSIVSDIMNSKGYWRFRVRNDKYQENKFSHPQLKELIRKDQVKLRGWYFPHMSEQEVTNHHGFIQSYSKTSVMYESLEFFRFFRSGQFFFMGTLREDDASVANELKLKGKKGLEFTRTIWTITEFFEFTRRLAVSGAFEGSMHIELSLIGSLDRQIYSADFNRNFHGEFVCRESSIQIEKEISLDTFLGESNKLAAEVINNIFHLFHLEELSMTVLEEEQRRLLERRF
jgi:hypothetical protein